MEIQIIQPTPKKVVQTDTNNQQWAMMNSMLEHNGKQVDDESAGFQKGNANHPKDNPYEMDIKGEKEDLTWLIK